MLPVAALPVEEKKCLIKNIGGEKNILVSIFLINFVLLDWLQSLKQFSSMCHIIYL